MKPSTSTLHWLARTTAPYIVAFRAGVSPPAVRMPMRFMGRFEARRWRIGYCKCKGHTMHRGGTAGGDMRQVCNLRLRLWFPIAHTAGPPSANCRVEIGGRSWQRMNNLSGACLQRWQSPAMHAPRRPLEWHRGTKRSPGRYDLRSIAPGGSSHETGSNGYHREHGTDVWHTKCLRSLKAGGKVGLRPEKSSLFRGASLMSLLDEPPTEATNAD